MINDPKENGQRLRRIINELLSGGYYPGFEITETGKLRVVIQETPEHQPWQHPMLMVVFNPNKQQYHQGGIWSFGKPLTLDYKTLRWAHRKLAEFHIMHKLKSYD